MGDVTFENHDLFSLLGCTATLDHRFGTLIQFFSCRTDSFDVAVQDLYSLKPFYKNFRISIEDHLHIDFDKLFLPSLEFQTSSPLASLSV